MQSNLSYLVKTEPPGCADGFDVWEIGLTSRLWAGNFLDNVAIS